MYSNGYRTTIGSPPGSLTLLWGEGGYPNPAEPEAAHVYDKIREPIQAWAGTPFAYDTLGLAVHFGLPGSGYANSSWFQYGTDNKPYLVFGDTRARDDDSIAHEYGHGLFVGFVPGQPGTTLKVWDEWLAGNEFYADYSSVVTDIWRRSGGVDPVQTWAISNLRDWRDPQTKGGTFQNRDWYGDWRYTVDKAWQAVGIRHACTAPPSVPIPNVESFLLSNMPMSMPGPAMIGLKWRTVVFSIVTTVVLATFYAWEASVARTGKVWPMPNFLGSTWYGPVMLLSIPICLGWLSLAPKRRYVRVIGLSLTLAVLAVCILFIVIGIEQVRPWLLPWWPPSRGHMQ